MEIINNDFDWKTDLKYAAIIVPVLLITGFLGWIENSRNHSEKYQEVMKFADKNKDGIVSLIEQKDAWTRMGYGGPFLEYKQLPKPSMYMLDLAIESYEDEN